MPSDGQQAPPTGSDGRLPPGGRASAAVAASPTDREQGGPAVSQPSSDAEKAVTLRGTVQSLHKNPKGDIDGLVLDDGTEVRFPPHMGQAMAEAIGAGDRVRVVARQHVTPKGDVHLHAESVTNLKTNEAVEVELPPRGKKPPKGTPPHEQILAELRTLRALTTGENAPETSPEAQGGRPHGPHHEQILDAIRET